MIKTTKDIANEVSMYFFQLAFEQKIPDQKINLNQKWISEDVYSELEKAHIVVMTKLKNIESIVNNSLPLEKKILAIKTILES